jgi:hypothetical protein
MRPIKAVILALLVSASLSAAPALTGITPTEAFTFGPTIIQITGTELSPSFVQCGDSNLCSVRVWFGELEGRVISASAARITAEAPGHPEGQTVNVRVRLADGTELVLPEALTFWSFPHAGKQNYMQYLVPVTAIDLPGSHGSLWTSQLVVHNASPHLAWLLPEAECSVILPFPITCPPEFFLFQPGETRAFPLGVDYRFGAFVYVPRPLKNEVDFQLRARDLSRENEGFGAEIPVVPLDAFTSSPADSVRLFNVPVDSRYRATLRIYGGDALAIEARIEIRSQSDGRLIERRFVTLLPGFQRSGAPGSAEFPLTPSYLQLDPLSDIVRASGEDRVLITVYYQLPLVGPPPFRLPVWAFISITNNVTQEVTVVTPHRP